MGSPCDVYAQTSTLFIVLGLSLARKGHEKAAPRSGGGWRLPEVADEGEADGVGLGCD